MNRRVLLSALLILSLTPLIGHADVTNQADKLKAVFIYNFAKYITWPEQHPEPTGFRLCVVGTDPVVEEIQRLSAKRIHNRGVEIHPLHDDQPVTRCHLIYFSESSGSGLESLLAKTSHQPILTVSSITDFIGRGGIIGFYWEENHIRFSINMKRADQARLKISSRLLKLARIVESP